MIKCVVALSGGRTSARMLRLLLDTMRDFAVRFIILFCNTGKELNATLDFVHEIETRWGVEVIWLEYTRVPAIEVNCGYFRNAPEAKRPCQYGYLAWVKKPHPQQAVKELKG